MIKRYLVFAFDDYYPIGGWGDFKSAHDTLEEARAAAKEIRIGPYYRSNVQVIDQETGEDVWDEL